MSVLSTNLIGLSRSRYVMSLIGMAIVVWKPELSQWIVALVGLAVGVSAIDAFRGGGSYGSGQQSGSVSVDTSEDDKA